MSTVVDLEAYRTRIQSGIQGLYPTLTAENIFIIFVQTKYTAIVKIVLKLPSNFHVLTVFDMLKDIKISFSSFVPDLPTSGLRLGILKVLYRGWWITFTDFGDSIYRIAENKRGAEKLEFVLNNFDTFSFVMNNKIR